MKQCRGRGYPRLDRDLGVQERAVTAVSTPPCHKDRCVSSALQALQIATSCVARAAWSGSGAIVDGKTECSSAEVADILLVWIATWVWKSGLSPR